MTNLTKVKIALWLGRVQLWLPAFVLFLTTRGFGVDFVMYALSLYYLLTGILEYPTGVFGDWVSHRVSVMLGSIFGALGMLLFVFATEQWQLIGVIGVFALGAALTSGSDKALLHSVSDDFRATLAQVQFIGIIISTIAITIGGFLAAVNLAYPMYASAFVAAVSAVILLFVRVQRDVDVVTHTPREIARDSLAVVRTHVVLKHVLVVLGVVGSVFFSLKWLYNPWFIELGLPIAWWGGATAVLTLAIAVGTFVARRVPARKTLYVFGVLLIMCFVAAGVTWLPLLAASMLFLAYFIRGYIETHFTVVLNDLVETHVRASVMSLESLLIRFGAAGVTAATGATLSATAMWGVMLFGAALFVVIGGYSFVRVVRTM